ncbi:hypothetical protein GJ496_009324 [Pomphorhynchus laevis]|nr:hypothetical protein GJ496_009324 [Pomphorhynchus laevis]
MSLAKPGKNCIDCLATNCLNKSFINIAHHNEDVCITSNCTGALSHITTDIANEQTLLDGAEIINPHMNQYSIDIMFLNFDMPINRACEKVIAWFSNVYHLHKCNASNEFGEILANSATSNSNELKILLLITSIKRKNISRRILLWKVGKLLELMHEARILPHKQKVKGTGSKPQRSWIGSFYKLMTLVKTRPAMRLLADHKNQSKVMTIDDDIMGMTVKEKLKF